MTSSMDIIVVSSKHACVCGSCVLGKKVKNFFTSVSMVGWVVAGREHAVLVKEARCSAISCGIVVGMLLMVSCWMPGGLRFVSLLKSFQNSLVWE